MPASPKVDIEALVATLGDDAVALPGSDDYHASTQPLNTIPTQAPAAVITPRDAAETSAAVVAAGRAGARIAVQATGHGAGHPLGDETVMISTRSLKGVAVDAEAKAATTGSGCVWSDVQGQAGKSGLIALSGTAADVGICGFTFGGGVGWMVRKYGLTAGHLRTVRYVDGTGRVRLASEEAEDELDREALWAFRGGTPVGIATEISFGLVEVEDLAAGYLMWAGEHAEALITAWAERLESLPPTITSTMSVRRLPPQGPFPDELKGGPAVHLSYASPAGEEDLAPLREALHAVAEPVVDTTGPSDAPRLATIHGDPPIPLASSGIGRWLAQPTAEQAVEVLAASRVTEPDGLVLAEMRHVATEAVAVEGAVTSPIGPIMLAAVGVAGDDASARVARDGLAHLQEAAAPLDLGRGQPSFYFGGPTAEDAYSAAEAERLNRIKAALDPEGHLGFERTPDGVSVAAA